jgi:apolipoprotein D and lipocalin family protein
MKLVLSFCLAWLSACTGVPEGVSVVDGFELDRYLGTWYEIARLDHSFERGLNAVTAEYSMREDGGLKVINSGYDAKKKERVVAEGRAYFITTPDQGKLKVSFFWPFYGGYNIIALDKVGYEYVMIAGPDRDYLWIMSRKPEMDKAVLSKLLQRAKQMGFAIDQLIYVTHS